MAQWNKQYLRCAAEMSQWETVAEYASVTENYGQLTDCLWRMHEWQRLKELVLPKTMVRTSFETESCDVLDVAMVGLRTSLSMERVTNISNSSGCQHVQERHMSGAVLAG